MSLLKTISKVFPTLLQLQKSVVPYIEIHGFIDRNTTIYVSKMLENIPKNKNRIALTINSEGGCPAQAHIILNKIQQKLKQNDAKLLTFGQQYVRNAAMLLLLSGNEVYVDDTSIIGGLEVGESKANLGNFNQYIRNVTYINSPSYYSELHRTESFDPAKKEEAVRVYKQFSAELNDQIQKLREEKISNNVDLTQFFSAEEAIKAGLVDKVGRIHQTFSREYPSMNLKLLEESKIQKWLHAFRRLDLSN